MSTHAASAGHVLKLQAECSPFEIAEACVALLSAHIKGMCCADPEKNAAADTHLQSGALYVLTSESAPHP
jgi:hypothetical protein